MVVIQIEGEGVFTKLDRASKPIQFGRDVFLHRVISRESISQAILILEGFSRLFKSWGIQSEDVFSIATSAIREAKNRDTFIDRIFIKTGLKISIAEGIEENHLTYLAVLHAVEDMKGPFARSSSLIMEVGGGSTELMIINRGKIVASHLFRLGILRLDATRGESDSFLEHNDPASVHSMLEQYRGTIGGIQAEYNLSRIRYFVMVGGDARTAASHCGKKQGEHYSIIQKNDFLAFLEKLEKYSVDDCVKLLNITYYEAESLLPALSVYRLFLQETSADEIIVPDVSIREGILLRFALGNDRKKEQEYKSQVLASVLSLGRKYHFNEEHGQHVCGLSIDFYNAFKADHGMGKRELLYLEVAALLHDIGYFVRATGHHKHGQYIIQNSEIFGLSLDELNIIGQIVRYHRSTRLIREHSEFTTLSQKDRLIVLKLSAILRVCDALDRGHVQRVKNIRLDIRESEICIYGEYPGDVSLERYALQFKSELFEEVFGYSIRLM